MAMLCPFAVHPDSPQRRFLGAAEHGPAAWPGQRAARPGPFAVARANVDLSEKTGGAHAAILRSDDRGETWRQLEGGIPTANPYMVSGIAIDPLDANQVFVTYTNGSVYVSSDAGETWNLLVETRDRLYGILVHHP